MELPSGFSSQMRRLLPSDEINSFLESLQEAPPVSFRPNPEKGKLNEFLERVPWCSTGFYLDKRPSFTSDPLFHAGTYYVQEASSMFVEQALKMTGEPQMVLDLCAAPGGKSTLLRTFLPEKALLVSNEPIRQRAQILSENITKWGHEGCLVTANYPKEIGKLGAIFDLVLVDAPCSGEGMFRKDNPAQEMWSEDNVALCAQRQREILADIWPAIKDGGYVIYSTCTYNTEENERNVQFIRDELGAEIIEIPVNDEWNIKGNLLKDEQFPVYHFLPHLTHGEGFFLALLRKTGDTETSPRIKSKSNFKKLSPEWAGKLKDDDMVMLQKNGTQYAVRRHEAQVVDFLQNHLNVMTFGIPLYEEKGKKQIPLHPLAMSRMLKKESFPCVELTREQALEFLHCMVLTIDAPRGYCLVTYQGIPLGFVNNLGARANNMYPQPWRIKSSYVK